MLTLSRTSIYFFVNNNYLIQITFRFQWRYPKSFRRLTKQFACIFIGHTCIPPRAIAARAPCRTKVFVSARLISITAFSASSEELKHTKPTPCDLAPSLTTYNKNQCVKDALHARLNHLNSYRICNWIMDMSRKIQKHFFPSFC